MHLSACSSSYNVIYHVSNLGLVCIDRDRQSRRTAAAVATHIAFVAMATATGNNQTAADR